jgi:hypothetical protein
MRNPEAMERGKAVSLEKQVLLVSLGVLIVGCIGYFVLPRGPLIFYVFAHVGALGLLGLIGGAVGILARKKGRGYLTALLLGSLLPIVSGLVAVAMIRGEKPCGGSVSLAVAALVVLAHLFTKKKTLPQP